VARGTAHKSTARSTSCPGRHGRIGRVMLGPHVRHIGRPRHGLVNQTARSAHLNKKNLTLTYLSTRPPPRSLHPPLGAAFHPLIAHRAAALASRAASPAIDPASRGPSSFAGHCCVLPRPPLRSPAATPASRGRLSARRPPVAPSPLHRLQIQPPVWHPHSDLPPPLRLPSTAASLSSRLRPLLVGRHGLSDGHELSGSSAWLRTMMLPSCHAWADGAACRAARHGPLTWSCRNRAVL
jgi:hypothetical protein